MTHVREPATGLKVQRVIYGAVRRRVGIVRKHGVLDSSGLKKESIIQCGFSLI